MHLQRKALLKTIRTRLRDFPVVSLFGSRQVGKTTLARDFIGKRKNVHFFDLEKEADLARLSSPGLASLTTMVPKSRKATSQKSQNILVRFRAIP